MAVGVRFTSDFLKILVIVNLGGGGTSQTPAIIPLSFFSKIGSKQMRRQILKIKQGHSTKSERRFMELLKKLHIPFRYKVKVKGREVDFIIGDLAIEIDGHPQSPEKNRMLINEGYDLLHLNSWEIPNPNLEQWLKNNGRIITIRPTSDNS